MYEHTHKVIVANKILLQTYNTFTLNERRVYQPSHSLCVCAFDIFCLNAKLLRTCFTFEVVSALVFIFIIFATRETIATYILKGKISSNSLFQQARCRRRLPLLCRYLSFFFKKFINAAPFGITLVMLHLTNSKGQQINSMECCL